MENIKHTGKSQRGQGAVEYALITLAVIGIVVVVLFNGGGLRTAIQGVFTGATNAINSTTAAAPAA